MNFPATLPAWGFMWGLAVLIYTLCKLASWSIRSVNAPLWKHLAYLFAWPGMDCDTFLNANGKEVEPPPFSEWLFAALKIVLGVALLWGLVPFMKPGGIYLHCWVAMISLAFILHFGLFHFLSCLWRSRGCWAVPVMNWPICSANATEFWGRRWNLAFRDLTYRFFFLPLKRPLGPSGALLAGFLVSGLVHDIVISWPSQGGWGWPTLYFVLQGAAIVAERSRLGRSVQLGQGIIGRLFAAAIVVIPLPLLFHTEFLRNVMQPFLEAMGV